MLNDFSGLLWNDLRHVLRFRLNFFKQQGQEEVLQPVVADDAQSFQLVHILVEQLKQLCRLLCPLWIPLLFADFLSQKRHSGQKPVHVAKLH